MGVGKRLFTGCKDADGPEVVLGKGGGGGVELYNRDTPAPTARAPTGLLQNRLNDTFTTHKIKVYIHNKTI